ncbi:MAG TPA: hypothetical protein VER68_02935 [Azonexus sp.]|nr:hypothetical protein [Azonexus sp.]
MGIDTLLVGVATALGGGATRRSPFIAAWLAMAIVLVLRLAAMRCHITLPALGPNEPR